MRKLYFSVLIFLLCVIVGISFYNRKTNVQKTDFAFDTVINISLQGSDAKKVSEKAFDMIRKYEEQLSVFKENSDVSLLNKSKSFAVSEDTFDLIFGAVKYSEKTDGYFDITVKSVMDLWNITNSSEGYVPNDEEITEALKKVGYKNISFSGENIILNNDASVDLGGIAKGYASNKLAKLIKDYNIKEAIIDMGGNIYVLGDREFKVGLQDPDGNRGDYFGICYVKNKSVVTSGAYERYFVKDGKMYHHILNPLTGKCADSGLKSVTIIGENSEKCDAYSTAIFAAGKEKGIELLNKESDLDYIIVDNDNNVYISDNVKFEIKNEKYKIS